MPAPGSPAEKALAARRIRSGKEHKKFTIPALSAEPEVEQAPDTPVPATRTGSGQRQQPKSKKRAKPAGPSQTNPGPPAKPAPNRSRAQNHWNLSSPDRAGCGHDRGRAPA